MGTARFVQSHWPLVRVTWPRDSSVKEFQVFATGFDELLARREPFGIVLEISGVERPQADVRAAIAEYQRSRSALTSRYVKGFAFIVDSPLLRGVLTAIRWLVPAAYPEANFASRDPAEAWLLERLNDAGVDTTALRQCLYGEPVKRCP